MNDRASARSARFTFGGFHHCEATDPRLLNIPWLATPTYIAMGYISRSVAQVLVARTHLALWRERVWAASIIATVAGLSRPSISC